MVKKYRPFRYHILFLFKLMTADKLSIKYDKNDYKKNCEKLYSILNNEAELYDYF